MYFVGAKAHSILTILGLESKTVLTRQHTKLPHVVSVVETSVMLGGSRINVI